MNPLLPGSKGRRKVELIFLSNLFNYQKHINLFKTFSLKQKLFWIYLNLKGMLIQS